MREKFVVQYRGKRYRVERGQPGSSAASGGGAPPGQDHWYISLNLAAITSLPVLPGESERQLRDRIREWLEVNPRLQESDQIFLGGG
jgi:hypothetical protein